MDYYGGGYLGDPRGRAEAIADVVRDDVDMDLEFKTEISLSDAQKNSSAGSYSSRAQEELSNDLTQEAIRSAPTAGDAWGAVKNARSFLTKEGGPYQYQSGLRKTRAIGESATYLGGLSALSSVHPALAVLALTPQGFFTEGLAKIGIGPSRTKSRRFFDAIRGDYFLSGSTLDRVNSSLWDLVLPEEIWENDN